MKENVIRSMELGVSLAACYMAAVTMVQTALYAKIVAMVQDSFIGYLVGDYIAYMDLVTILLALLAIIAFWRRGDADWFGRIFMLNMLMFFPSVLDFSTFNWVGLILDLPPVTKVTALWVFTVGLLLQVAYLTLRHSVRFREMRQELLSRGAVPDDIDQVSGGQMGYLIMLVTATAVLTAAIYLAVPYIGAALGGPLGSLPVPHVVIGVVVVLGVATALILYLRSSSQ
ncbi:MAG: hypothetical protein ABIJ47_10450 [Candidatus Bathyarchaeota archaeon]